MLKMVRKEVKLIAFFTLILFLATLPLINQINFMQNDDWVYYRIVTRFLSGNFTLEPISGATFYVQAVMGYLFSLLFGINKLPFLTVAVSFGNFLVFILILHEKFKFKLIDIVLIGSILLLNPLHVYLSWGFMTENYLLFFTLISTYFYFRFLDTRSKSFLLLALLFGVLSFFVKQLGLVILFAYSVDLFLKNKRRESLCAFVTAIAVMFFYYMLFPRTDVMLRKGFDLTKVTDLFEFFLFLSQWILYLVSFTIPLIISYLIFDAKEIKKWIFRKKFTLVILTIFFWGLITYLLQSYNYPFHANTFLNKGFFPGGLNGNKYHFAGFYDLFLAWKQVSIALSALIVSLVIINIKKIKIDFSLIYSVMYIFVLLVLPSIFDRYLVLLVPFVTIFLLDKIKKLQTFNRLIIIGFLGLLLFVSYQYSMDYIQWQNYVWNRATDLVQRGQVEPNTISSSRAWNKHFEVVTLEPFYKFSFDKPEVLSDDRYELVEERKIEFLGSIWVNPYVYLYRLK